MQNEDGAGGAVWQAVERHIQAGVVAARGGRRCIDGRYLPASPDSGRLARPGADFGCVLALLATNRGLGLGWSVEACARRVFEAVVKTNGVFSMHSAAAGPGNGRVAHCGLEGCRHIALSTTAPDDFELDAAEVRRAYDFVTTDAGFAAQLYMAVLGGENRESAVLVVQDRERSFEPRDADGRTYFVYDRARDEDFTAALARRMALSPDAAPAFRQAARRQALTTLRALARRVPVFVVRGQSAERWQPAPEFERV